MCAKGQMFLEFSLMWIWVTCLLAFFRPQDHLDLIFHYPIEALHKEPLGYIQEEELKSKKTIVHCWRSLYLSLHPFVPWSTLCSSQLFPLLVSLLSRDRGLRWWRPRWRTHFLQFTDVLTEVVTCVLFDLININICSCPFNVQLNEYWIHGYV